MWPSWNPDSQRVLFLADTGPCEEIRRAAIELRVPITFESTQIATSDPCFDFADYDLILLASPGREVLPDLFDLVRRVWSIKCRPGQAAPDVVIMTSVRLPGSVIADGEECGCRVELSLNSQQLAQLIDSALVERRRFRDRGPLLLLVPDQDPIVVGVGGQHRLLKLNDRERSILEVLSSAAQGFNTLELAEPAGCAPNHVKVYICRLNRKFALIWRNLGKTASKQLIESLGRSYRLSARVKTR